MYQPWDTANNFGTGSEARQSEAACWLHQESHELIHLRVDTIISYNNHVCVIVLRGTMSKAFAKFTMVKSVTIHRLKQMGFADP